eukprot:148390-Amphidinium_carterae.1
MSCGCFGSFRKWPPASRMRWKVTLGSCRAQCSGAEQGGALAPCFWEPTWKVAAECHHQIKVESTKSASKRDRGHVALSWWSPNAHVMSTYLRPGLCMAGVSAQCDFNELK